MLVEDGAKRHKKPRNPRTRARFGAEIGSVNTAAGDASQSFSARVSPVFLAVSTSPRPQALDAGLNGETVRELARDGLKADLSPGIVIAPSIGRRQET